MSPFSLIPPPSRAGRISPRAFTLVDLLAVLAVLAVCALMLAPVLARTRQDTRTFQCLNNNRELNRAWRMFVAENQDRLPYAAANPQVPASSASAWVTGTMDFNPANRSNWDPYYDLMKSPLWPYCGTNLNLWKCPSDRSYVVVSGVPRPRVRSYSMNLYLGGWGGTDGGWNLAASYRLYAKLTDLNDPPPARLFVFVDMREDSINNGSCWVDMAGYSPRNPAVYHFYDLPGAYHDGAATFSFADGHTEVRHWEDRRTIPPLVSGLIPGNFATPNNMDIAWLQERATRPK